jgi:hypothetical protein
MNMKPQSLESMMGPACGNGKLSDQVRRITAHAEHVILDVDDHGKTRTLESTLARKPFFPQEFLLAVQIHRRFEFVGWFMNFELRRPRGVIGRPIVILRKR